MTRSQHEIPVPEDLDDSLRFMHHEIEFRGVPHNMQLAGGGEYSSPRSHKQHHRPQGDDVELPG